MTTPTYHYQGTPVLLEATGIVDADGNPVTPDVVRIYVRHAASDESTTVQLSADSIGEGFAKVWFDIPDDALPGRWLFAFDLDGAVVDQYKPGTFNVLRRPVNVAQA